VVALQIVHPSAKERPFGGTSHLTSTVVSLAQAGVRFEHYGGMNQDELGIWISPTGAKVAWFKDPDGNTLSISEHPELR
jgi:hypothetical protein